jgi:hypothetical protein
MTEALRSTAEIEVEQVDYLRPLEKALGNPELPIANHRAEIESAIGENSVTILVAPTGSGKTTQVPQYAREMCDDQYYSFDEIIVTQPRIVAARTLSERVAEEIAGAGEIHSVGYYTSKERTPAPQRDQHIAFLTDGKAAAQLLHQGKQPNPDTKRLLIIDEVHEWNLNTEQLIAIAMEKTDPQSPRYDANFKVVIMSATMNSRRLQKHFEHAAPPVIEVEVPTHEVTRSMTNRSVANVALNVAARSRGKVLAFLPGKREIKKVMTVAEDRQSDNVDCVPVISLHGQQTAKKQREAFRDYPRGVVIATTNAAETSLTVPGAIAVVDSGEVRTDRVSYDLVRTGSEGLYLEEASQANLNQRAGRVGRTGPGEYVLCSPDGKSPAVPHEDRPEYATPAMERSRLDGLLLRLKATGHEIDDFRFFHKPPPEAVKAARKRLFTLGALTENGAITERGLQMEKLPLDPEYSCMIAFAYEKGYSDEVKANLIDIAAIMQPGGILKRAPKEQRWRELLATDVYDDVRETDSDFAAQLEAYTNLFYNIDKTEWGEYDIIEHSAGLVEQTRASLADKLGLTLRMPSTIEPENRQAVLTCINAGQLNQLWQRSGETWSLVLGTSEEYELSGSSVVGELGELATGSLFSLGIRDKTLHTIQNVNRIVSTDSLEQAAGHLITEAVDPSTTRYDPEKQQLVALVERKLGSLVLRSFPRTIETTHDSPEIELIQEGHRKYAWDIWPEHNNPRTAYDLETVSDAIVNPESAQYGVDPVTGEALLAWKGGNGQWCVSRDVAVRSLESRLSRLTKAPQEAELRELKAAISEASNKLAALRRSGYSVKEIKRLLNTKKKQDKTVWLNEAQRLLESAQIA